MTPATSPPPVPIDLRHAAALGAGIIAGLLVLQYGHRRKAFILAWAAGWLLVVAGLLLISTDITDPIAARLVTGSAQFLDLAVTLLFFWSGELYRQTHYLGRRHLKFVAGAAVWFILVPFVLGPRTLGVSGYLANAFVYAATAAVYGAVLIERRMIGAGVIAFAMVGLAIANLTNAFVDPSVWLTASYWLNLFLAVSVLGAMAGLGINLLIFEDMTYELRMTNRRLEAAREELIQAAITDPLTGCHNRRFLDQVMDRELQRHARFKLPLSLLFIDVDRFKAINDTLGHEAGDRVLKYVARFLKRHIREADYVFRWGGDEFLVLITCAGQEAQKKAASLKAAFDAAPEAVDLPPGIGLSVGWIEVPEGTDDLAPLVREADARMYEDKRT